MMKSTVFAVAALSAVYILDAGPAHAYIDPGTGSILLQGIIGGAATFMVVLRLYGAKLKRKLLSVFGSDPGDAEIEESEPSPKSAE